jgi:hypothetical protein
MTTITTFAQGITYSFTCHVLKNEFIDISNNKELEGKSDKYATMSAITLDDDIYNLIITKDWIDTIEDSFIQTIFRSKPNVIMKLFSGEYNITHEINKNTLTCSIKHDILDVIFDFILEKEKVDDYVLLRRQIIRLERRVKELEVQNEIEKSLEYIDMPSWETIEKDVVELFDRLDPEYIKFKTEQQNTTREAMVQKFFSTFSPMKKYASWLTLLFYSDKKIIFDAQYSKFTECIKYELHFVNIMDARFKRNNSCQKFRKFFITLDKTPKETNLLLKIITDSAMCTCNICLGRISICISYIDY